MKRKKTANLPDISVKGGIWGIVRMFFSAILLLHKGLGVWRIAFAYIFFAFALISLIFTVSVPQGAEFVPATTSAKVQSRMLTAFMMIINLGVYGIIMNWHKSSIGLIIIRITMIGLLLYFDVIIIGRVIYALIRNGSFF